LPNEAARVDIIRIHSAPMSKKGEIDFDAVVKLADGFVAQYNTPLLLCRRSPQTNRFNGADLRNVCTEAGMFAIRADRDYVVDEDFMKAVRKVCFALSFRCAR